MRLLTRRRHQPQVHLLRNLRVPMPGELRIANQPKEDYRDPLLRTPTRELVAQILPSFGSRGEYGNHQRLLRWTKRHALQTSRALRRPVSAPACPLSAPTDKPSRTSRNQCKLHSRRVIRTGLASAANPSMSLRTQIPAPEVLHGRSDAHHQPEHQRTPPFHSNSEISSLHRTSTINPYGDAKKLFDRHRSSCRTPRRQKTPATDTSVRATGYPPNAATRNFARR